MTKRVIRGKHPLSGNYGIYVSNVGVDVTTAQPGEFLYDSSSIAYQKVLNGTTTVLINKAPGVSQTTTVSLPSEYSGYSHLQMWAAISMYLLNSSGTTYEGDVAFDSFSTKLSMSISSGVLSLTASSAQDTRNVGVSSVVQFYFVANWAIFNARVDA